MEQLQVIQSKIYEVRGQKVMLDKDLAELYQVTTGNLNKAVKRNIKRFPPDFMFQLTDEEWEAEYLKGTETTILTHKTGNAYKWFDQDGNELSSSKVLGIA